jgi:hypothetical protein
LGPCDDQAEEVSEAGLDTDYADDRRVGEDASLMNTRSLTILISAATPAPYRYTGCSLVPLISVSFHAAHSQKDFT